MPDKYIKQFHSLEKYISKQISKPHFRTIFIIFGLNINVLT
jgi:hypothetical protein